MRRVLLVTGVLALAACSSFGTDSSSPPDADAGAGAHANLVDSAVESGTDAGLDASATFCPVPGALFCSDFDHGPGLVDEWGPDTPIPTRFLTLEQSPGHGRVMRATLDPTSLAAAKDSVLARNFQRPPSPVTYAFDLRVDTSAPMQEVEVATLRTDDAVTTVAFEIGVKDTIFFFAEYAKGDAGTGYKESSLGTIDNAWHRFEVKVTYGPASKIEVRKDGAVVIPMRATVVTPAAPLAAGLVLSVGVNLIRANLQGSLSYELDNVTFFQ